VFQVWTVDDGGGPKGEAVLANSGDLAKEFEFIPAEAVAPTAPAGVAFAEAGVSLSAATVAQGHALEVRIGGAATGAVVELNGVSTPAICDGGALLALLPVSTLTDPGPAVVKVTIGASQPTQVIETTLSITASQYETYDLALSAETEALLAPEVIQEERVILDAVFGAFTPERRWDGAFALPATGPFTSPFGERRYYGSSGLFDYHAGQDIAVGAGTPVAAAQRGTVAWAGPLKVRGNAVIIDHGLGLFTAYYHLSRIDVAVGAQVEQGQTIAASGNTGLSTGPHVHWEMRLHKVPIDPIGWTVNPLPRS